MSSSRARVIAAALSAIAWSLAAVAARARGFHELSDDDHARVIIAEAFARAPKLDPSGTSWLPFPFWVNGAAMMVFGRSLDVAHGVSVAAAGMCGALSFVTATRLRLGTWSAFFSAMLPLTIPLVPALAAATVPELPTACLTAFAIASACAGSPVQAAVAIGCACLSRYEVWPVAFVLAAHAALTAWAEPDGRGRAWLGAALTIAAPAAWLAHNAVTHGSATWFSQRVAMFRDASGVAADAFAFPRAAFSGAPAHVAAAAIGVALLGREAWRRAWLPLSCALLLVLGLVVAAMRGTTPTHHPERAVLLVWLLACPVFALTLPEVFATRLGVRPSVSLVIVIAASLLIGWLQGRPTGTQDDRRAWEATGRSLAASLPRGERVLVVPESFSYLAAISALGRPEDVAVVTLRRVDPRGTTDDDPTTSLASVCACARREGAGRALLSHAQAAKIGELPPSPEVLAAGLFFRCPG